MIRETLQLLSRLQDGDDEDDNDDIASRSARWSEACRIASTLPVSPTRVRELLDRGMSEARVRAHVDAAMTLGLEP